MSGLATQANQRSVTKYINSIEDPQKKEDCQQIRKMMEEATQQKAQMWGNEKNPDYIIGFGSYEYTRKGGKEVFTWFHEGFAPRSANITIYLTLDLDQENELLAKLGKYKKGKGCLYIKRLSDVDTQILAKLMRKSKNAKYGSS